MPCFGQRNAMFSPLLFCTLPTSLAGEGHSEPNNLLPKSAAPTPVTSLRSIESRPAGQQMDQWRHGS